MNFADITDGGRDSAGCAWRSGGAGIEMKRGGGRRPAVGVAL